MYMLGRDQNRVICSGLKTFSGPYGSILERLFMAQASNAPQHMLFDFFEYLQQAPTYSDVPPPSDQRSLPRSWDRANANYGQQGALFSRELPYPCSIE